MKKGYGIWQKYLQGKQAIEKMKNSWAVDEKDQWLSQEDKRNRRGAAMSEAQRAVEQLSGDIVTSAIDKHADAHVSFKRRLHGNKGEVAAKAAVMGQAYAQMSDKELLRVLNAKFEDAADRGLIMQFLEARVTSKEQPKPTGGPQPVEDPLQSKIDEVISRNVDKLTGTDASYLEDLRTAQKAENFALNAARALELDLKHAAGELQVTSPELIQRRDALNAVEGYVNNGDPFTDNYGF